MKNFHPFCLNLVAGFLCLPLLALLIDKSPHEKISRTQVDAIVKTDDVENQGDAADDPCIYINEADPTKSLVIGTDKQFGLRVYDLAGKVVQQFPEGNVNNVDLRYGFKLGDRTVPLISAGNRKTNTVDFYFIDDKDNLMKPLSIGEHEADIVIYGSCMYRNPHTKKMYVFINSRDGEVVQFSVTANADMRLTLEKTRELMLDSQVEGCVADDDLNRFYIGEERKGIWQFGADPKTGTDRKLLDHTDEGGNLVADVEGLAIYRIGRSDGYLLASSQGENAFNVYQRKDGAYIGKFEIHYNGKIIEDTDGIDITSHHLSDKFPFGMLVVQDGNKTNSRQSFKYAKWEDIAQRFDLKRNDKDPIIEIR